MALSKSEKPSPFAKESKVRFKDEYLLRCDAEQARRLRGRVGNVAGYRAGAIDPIVDFPRSGRFPPLRLFEVRSSNLEVVAVTTGDSV